MLPKHRAQFMVGRIASRLIAAIHATLDVSSTRTERIPLSKLPSADKVIQVGTKSGMFFVLLHARKNNPDAPRVQIMDARGKTSTYFLDLKENTWRPDPKQLAKTLKYKVKAYE